MSIEINTNRHKLHNFSHDRKLYPLLKRRSNKFQDFLTGDFHFKLNKKHFLQPDRKL